MRIQRPNATAGTSIVTLADMKEFLRVDGTDEDDTITALMNAAVQHCTDYTGRHFTAGDACSFFLERWRSASLAFGPVTQINSVAYYDTAGNLQTLPTTKYYHDSFVNGTTRIHFHDVPDLQTYNSTPIEIDCDCGEAASPNIKHAVRMLTAHWYENRRAVITATPNEMPMGVQALLNPERIVDLQQ